MGKSQETFNKKEKEKKRLKKRQDKLSKKMRQERDPSKLRKLKNEASDLTDQVMNLAAGLKPGRERDNETILFWHLGLATSDIALGAAMLDKARAMGVVQHLIYA